ncbi:response regulator [Mucilaginibacter flavidus]|uniref:response regulator n=1 Tax=Mucilaginibacter flavidus TaxID=2949309 RepID=UPI002093598F|nr:response regulator [Mucilaginibacter flavidus]MCO5950535.1 response regulator [Mucilaginibacter flavidus]
MSKKILVLDDDPDLLEVIDLLLTGEGYDILTLTNGEHFEKNIEQFCPDLILMDVMLAGLDGRKLCQRIKANLRNKMPVILISGTHDLQQVMNQIGPPNDFISKPFDIYELLKRVEVQLSA